MAKDSRIASLDLLRVAAALAVVAFHYLWRDAMVHRGGEGAVEPALYGYLGVNLFFLISGFVIAQSAEGRSAWQFAVARFARIYPGFVACMTLTALLLALAADPRFPIALHQYIANLAILSPALGHPFVDGVYWSIVLELVFYGWVALAVLTGVFDRFRLEFVAGWLALAMLNEFWLGSGAMRLLFVTEFAGWFAAGMLIEHMRRKGIGRIALLLLGAAMMHSAATLSVTSDWMLTHYGVAAAPVELLAVHLALHGVFILAVTVAGSWRAGALVAGLGALTYPLYLLHQNIGYVVIRFAEPMAGRWGAAALALGGALVLSWIVWRCVERPGGAWLKGALGGRLFARWRDMPLAIAS